MQNEYFAPGISADTRFFWEGTREHKLLAQRCKKCGKLRWPASYLCPECLSDDTELAELSGEGVLYSFTVFHKPFHPSLSEKVPYIVCEVDLKEGIRIVSNLAESGGVRPACGSRLKVCWQELEGYTKPVFKMEET